MAYGDKRDYPKIDIYVNEGYVCSTTWARTCYEAIQEFKKKNPNIADSTGHDIKARREKSNKVAKINIDRL